MVMWSDCFHPEQGFCSKETDFTSPITGPILIKKLHQQTRVLPHLPQAVHHQKILQDLPVVLQKVHHLPVLVHHQINQSNLAGV